MSISCLPPDLHSIFKVLTLKDTYNCMYVCKEWNAFFKLDTLWEHFAIEFKVADKSNKFKAVHKTLSGRAKILRNNNISREFLLAFSIIFGKDTFVHQFPVTELSYTNMVWLPGAAYKFFRIHILWLL